MSTPATLDCLLRSGKLRQALAVLADPRVHSLQGPTEDVARADLLQKVGNGALACTIAERHIHSPGATSDVRAKANLVLGNECREKGDVNRSLQHLRKAIELADQSHDLRTRCQAEIAFMLAAHDAPDTDIPRGFLADVRRHVSGLGDPQVTAQLHMSIAEIETKRGVLDAAGRHLRVARAVLKSSPNACLDGTWLINAACLSFLRSDFEDALDEAKDALVCGHSCGHRGTQRAAAANLGHLYLVSEQIERAEAWLRQAWRMSSGGASEAGILDGLAQVKLASRQFCDCASFLDQVRTVSGAGMYHSFCASVTRLKLLLRQKRGLEAIEAAAILASRLAACNDRSFPTVVDLLKAEGFLMTGRRAEAIDVICRVADSGGEKRLDTLPRVAHIIGRVHAVEGDPLSADVWFEHSARIFAACDDEHSRVEVLTDYADLLWPVIGQLDAGDSRRTALSVCGRPAACRVTLHPGGTTRLVSVGAGLSAGSALTRATTLIDLASQPRFVGTEVLDILQRCNAIRGGAVLTRGEGQEHEMLTFSGDYTTLPRLLGMDPGVERIALGRWRDKDVELRVQVQPALDGRAAVIAAKRLVDLGLELDGARNKERERTALWPLDEPIESRYGVFVSRAMLDLAATARRIASSNATVLVTGETGTGKELLARMVHDASPRAAAPFVPFNCAAVPRDMLDSQLFGHRRGAFTGAVSDAPGVIRSAAGGTLLLDEVGEIPLDLQPKLLRFLESGEVQPVGEPHPVGVDVRVLASTNAELEQLVAAGRFRDDLYYRLNVIRLRIPPLRERREEIPVLVQQFLARFAKENAKENLRVAEETMEYLLLYAWPGNVRELLNQMRRLAALAEDGAVLMPDHLSPEIVAARRTVPAAERDVPPCEVVVRLDQPLAAAIEQVERAIVPWALRSAGERVDEAAKMLGLSRKGLYLKRQRLGLDIREPGPPPRRA